MSGDDAMIPSDNPTLVQSRGAFLPLLETVFTLASQHLGTALRVGTHAPTGHSANTLYSGSTAAAGSHFVPLSVVVESSETPSHIRQCCFLETFIDS